MNKPPILQIKTSPHITLGADTPAIMRNVVFALLPATVFGVYVYYIIHQVFANFVQAN